MTDGACLYYKLTHEPNGSGELKTESLVRVKQTITMLYNTGDHFIFVIKNEPPRDKTNKMACAPSETQISLGIRPVCSESLLSS